jgi:hypothetical protein
MSEPSSKACLSNLAFSRLRGDKTAENRGPQKSATGIGGQSLHCTTVQISKHVTRRYEEIVLLSLSCSDLFDQT